MLNQGSACDRGCVLAYLETQQSHLLKAYEADLMTKNAIQATKARYYYAMISRDA